jgi:hypothetical protein
VTLLPILIIVPALLFGVALYAAISRMGVIPNVGDSGVRPSRSGRFGGGDYAEDPLWPVRQVQRIPQPVLIGLVVAMGVWVVGWLVVFFVGLGLMSV